jgi:hypothetical protein
MAMIVDALNQNTTRNGGVRVPVCAVMCDLVWKSGSVVVYVVPTIDFSERTTESIYMCG